MDVVRFQPAVQRRILSRDATVMIATPNGASGAICTGVLQWWPGGGDALA